MRTFVSVAEAWVLKGRSPHPSTAQREDIRAFGLWLSNRFLSADGIPDVARAWDEYARDPSERTYSVWHTPPHSTVQRTDPLPTRTLAAAQHRAEEYLSAGERAGITALHPTADAPSSVDRSTRVLQHAAPFPSATSSGPDSSSADVVHASGKVQERRSLLAAAAIALAATSGLLVATLLARWIELQLY